MLSGRWQEQETGIILLKYRILYVSYDIIFIVAAPRQAQKGGVCLELAISFIISVLASIVAYYICKWLDRDDNGNEPKE